MLHSRFLYLFFSPFFKYLIIVKLNKYILSRCNKFRDVLFNKYNTYKTTPIILLFFIDFYYILKLLNLNGVVTNYPYPVYSLVTLKNSNVKRAKIYWWGGDNRVKIIYLQNSWVLNTIDRYISQD